MHGNNIKKMTCILSKLQLLRPTRASCWSTEVCSKLFGNAKYKTNTTKVHKIIYVYIYSCNFNYGGVTVLKVKTLDWLNSHKRSVDWIEFTLVLSPDRRRSAVSGRRMRTQRVPRGRSSPCSQQASGRATRRRGREQNAPRTGPSSAQCSEHWSGSWDQHILTASACRLGGVMKTVGFIYFSFQLQLLHFELQYWF